MSIRWLLVLAVLAWLLYEYLIHSHIQAWSFDSRYAKVIIGLIIILILCFTPSLESLLQNNGDIQKYLQKILLNEDYTYHYNQHASVNNDILHKMQNGANMAGNTIYS